MVKIGVLNHGVLFLLIVNVMKKVVHTILYSLRIQHIRIVLNFLSRFVLFITVPLNHVHSMTVVVWRVHQVNRRRRSLLV